MKGIEGLSDRDWSAIHTSSLRTRPRVFHGTMVLVFISMISTKLNYNDVSMHTAHCTEREMYSTGKGRQYMYAACMPCAIYMRVY